MSSHIDRWVCFISEVGNENVWDSTIVNEHTSYITLFQILQNENGWDLTNNLHIFNVKYYAFSEIVNWNCTISNIFI